MQWIPTTRSSMVNFAGSCGWRAISISKSFSLLDVYAFEMVIWNVSRLGGPYKHSTYLNNNIQSPVRNVPHDCHEIPSIISSVILLETRWSIYIHTISTFVFHAHADWLILIECDCVLSSNRVITNDLTFNFRFFHSHYVFLLFFLLVA